MARITKRNKGWRIETDKQVWFACYDNEYWYVKGIAPAGITDIGCKIKPVLFESESEMIEAIGERKETPKSIEEEMI